MKKKLHLVIDESEAGNGIEVVEVDESALPSYVIDVIKEKKVTKPKFDFVYLDQYEMDSADIHGEFNAGSNFSAAKRGLIAELKGQQKDIEKRIEKIKKLKP